jgi:hypothetical protein
VKKEESQRRKRSDRLLNNLSQSQHMSSSQKLTLSKATIENDVESEIDQIRRDLDTKYRKDKHEERIRDYSPNQT